MSATKTGPPIPEKQAWKALGALCIGFFMILLDQTIVAVATPDFQQDFNATYNQVMWVTSVYLLAYAVPLLLAGRLGDQWGPHRLYIVGMVIFTLSSLACGLSSGITQLIVARGFQGLGAALLTPQTFSVINRIFARERRGAAMGVWGVVAGLATLTGPVLGGLLTSTVGWEWIFFVNVPFGVFSIIMVMRLVPRLETHNHGYDWTGIVLSIVAVFGFVFALQQGDDADWAPWIWITLIGSLALFAIFLWNERRAARRGVEVLVPLGLFKDRNFAVGNLSISTQGFAVAAPMIPIMIYLQSFHHLSAFQAGLMLIPSALFSGGLAPLVGRLTDTIPPRRISVTGFSFMVLSMLAFAAVMRPGMELWWMFLPICLFGLGNAFVWAPNSTTTMRDLPLAQAGAGSGIYNTTRQMGAVVGSAAIAAGMQVFMRITDPQTALGLTMLIPAAVLLIGLAAVTQFHGTTEATADQKLKR